MRTRNGSNRRIGQGLQQLESRQLMAGDVAVAMISGDLIITGDDLDNRVDITTVNGQFRVSGTNWNGATTINGNSAAFLVNVASVDDIRVDTKLGNDRLFLNGVHLTATTHGEMDIKTSGGNDLVGVYNSSARDVKLDVGDGNDIAVSSYSNFHNDFFAQLGSGDDTLSLMELNIGDDLDIRGGSGKDSVAVQYVDCVDDLSARLGDGNDILYINGGRFDDTSIYGDLGDDRVTVNATQIDDDLYVEMGSGADKLYLYNNNVDGDEVLFGGFGADVLVYSGNNFTTPTFVNSF
jgi:hypothetical protein